MNGLLIVMCLVCIAIAVHDHNVDAFLGWLTALFLSIGNAVSQ